MLTVALLLISCNAGAPVISLALDDLHVHKAWAQVQKLQVVAYDCRQVLVVPTISVPVQVGGVLAPLTINQGVPAQLLRDPAPIIKACCVCIAADALALLAEAVAIFPAASQHSSPRIANMYKTLSRLPLPLVLLACCNANPCVASLRRLLGLPSAGPSKRERTKYSLEESVKIV